VGIGQTVAKLSCLERNVSEWRVFLCSGCMACCACML